MDGDPRLDRAVHVVVDGLDTDGYRVSLARIDAHHSNLLDEYPDDVAWPDDELWQSLRERDALDEHELRPIGAGESRASLEITVPMPGVARVRLTPMTKEGSR
jgi:heme oxygenase